MKKREHQFEYLRKAARKYGNIYVGYDFEKFADQVNKKQLEELSTVYLEIMKREDSFRISRWMGDCAINSDQKSKEELRFSSRVEQMFAVFRYLADRDIAPFNSRQV